MSSPRTDLIGRVAEPALAAPAEAPADLAGLGWTAADAVALGAMCDPALVPGRVVSDFQGLCRVATSRGVWLVARPEAAVAAIEQQAAVGDFVALRLGDPPQIVSVLPRRTLLMRRAAGDAARAQLVAANIDVLFVVTATGQDFSLRRTERYLAVALAGGCSPVFVVNKADLGSAAVPRLLQALRAVVLDHPVIATSAETGLGVDSLLGRLGPGRTAGFVGSSGVGKSTLINRMCGATVQHTQPVRAEDERGRHTTTHRALLVLPGGGGLVIDTPGMRELGLWDAEGLALAFADVEVVAGRCRWRDCRHHGDSGCEVHAAVQRGDLVADRVESWHRLRAEVAERAERRSQPRRKGRRQR